MQPIAPEHELEARILQVQNQGYTVVPDAIAPERLAFLRRRFDELMADYQKAPNFTLHHETNAIDINQLWEYEPEFEELMDLPTIFPIVERLLDRPRLLGGAIANYTPPGAGSRGAWHHDGHGYIRATYILSDLGDAEGPTAVMPGSHHAARLPPDWFSSPNKFTPYEPPGMVPVTGRAGTCMVNNTLLWHTGTPNTSDQPRRIIWVVYKSAAWDNEPPEHLRNTPEFCAALTNPRHRRLVGLTS